LQGKYLIGSLPRAANHHTKGSTFAGLETSKHMNLLTVCFLVKLLRPITSYKTELYTSLCCDESKLIYLAASDSTENSPKTLISCLLQLNFQAQTESCQQPESCQHTLLITCKRKQSWEDCPQCTFKSYLVMFSTESSVWQTFYICFQVVVKYTISPCSRSQSSLLIYIYKNEAKGSNWHSDRLKLPSLSLKIKEFLAHKK
jgi:hypothetical protein